MQKLEFEGIGSTWLINLFDVDKDFDLIKLKKILIDRVEQFDKDYSRFRKDSLIYQMSQNKGEYELPDDAKPLFDLYYKLSEITNGLFTPLVGRTMEEAGYDSKYSLKPKEFSRIPSWEEALEYNYPKMKIRIPMTLDIGAAGKGYLIDLIGEILKNHNIEKFSLNVGGDILHANSNQPLMVGLENPNNVNQVIGVVELLNGSICGSAGNRRKWDRFHHIINPHTHSSNWDILATWVTAVDTITADALATSLFLVDPEVVEKEYKFEYLILNKDFSIKKSENFKVKFFEA